MTFESFSLDPRITAGVRALGYRVPTPIQLQAIPPIMQGRDVMGLAQTGTGKTAAFVLPILQRLLHEPRGNARANVDSNGRGHSSPVRALILAPTRELAEQIHEAVGELGKRTGIRSVSIYGGVGNQPQVMQLRRGVEIVVACPGRLLDHIGQNTISLSKLEVLVVDEADRMFDMGFLPEVRRILRHLPSERQTLLFSATMPTDVRHLANEILRDPLTLQIRHTEPVDTVSHALYPVAQHLKTALLVELLRDTDAESVLVFTRTKHRAKRLAEQLGREGYSVTSLQGNLSQNRRQAALDGFRDGTYQIMVATDIAARGIDVTRISHVINYDAPDTADAYTHRIGRTGRAAKTGDAFTLVTGDDADLIRSVERVLGSSIERKYLEEFDYRKAAPARNTEFARPPREPQRRRPQPAVEKEKPKSFGGSRTPSALPQPESPARAGARRSAPWTTSGQAPVASTSGPVAAARRQRRSRTGRPFIG